MNEEATSGKMYEIVAIDQDGEPHSGRVFSTNEEEAWEKYRKAYRIRGKILSRKSIKESELEIKEQDSDK